MAGKPPPALHIPSSDTTVKISAIDSTIWLDGPPCSMMWKPEIKGFDRMQVGAWCFLIEHPSGRKLVYDLGTRKDYQNLAPALGLQQMLESGFAKEFKVEKNMSEILVDGGLKLEGIEGIIWSHWHFDHTGDPSTFPSTTKLIVGEGFGEAYLPGYPQDPNGHVLESDFADRELMEVPFSKSDLHIGRFKAFDYFGDGSFFILESPGHAIGHINALARTSTSPTPSFIHLGGDSIHSAAEIRPSEYLPLPDKIEPSPVPKIHASSCPGDFFTPVLRDGSKTKHILEWQDAFAGQGQEKKYGLIVDEPALRDTIEKNKELDIDRDIFTLIAHDWSLKGILPEWPASLNNWREKGLKKSTQWKFLEDFAGACC